MVLLAGDWLINTSHLSPCSPILDSAYNIGFLLCLSTYGDLVSKNWFFFTILFNRWIRKPILCNT